MQESNDVFSALAAASDMLQAEAEEATSRASEDVSLMALAEEYALLTDSINQQETELKKLKSRRETLRKINIPEAMRALGMVVNNKGAFSFALGKIHLETRTYVSVKDGEDEQLFAWLRANGAGNLIKNTVNASSLAAMVRELREEGAADPPHVAVYEETAVKLTGRK